MAAEQRGRVRADHPSLAGHFPSHPVVPGVVMLGEVMAVVRQALGENVMLAGLPHVKLLLPLAPEVPFTICIEQQAEGMISFSCRAADSSLIAQGALEYRCRTA